MITKKELKKEINSLLKRKKYTNKVFRYFELYVNIYLVMTNKRKLTQLHFYKKYERGINYSHLKKLLNKIYPYYIMENDYETVRIVLYNKKYNIKKMNKTFTKKYAKDLGDFYVCAGDLEKMYKKHKILMRPKIVVRYINNKGNIIEFDLFVQMCPANKLTKNFAKMITIKNRFKKYINKINKDITMSVEMGIFNKT